MKNFLKILFCNHTWEIISGNGQMDDSNTYFIYMTNIYICKKCSKIKEEKINLKQGRGGYMIKKKGIYEQGLDLMSRTKIIEVALALKFLLLLSLSLNIVLFGIIVYLVISNN